MTQPTRKLISIVTPVFNEIDTVRQCSLAIKNLFENELTNYDYEHLFCDNDSTDGTTQVLRELAEKDQHIKVIFNNRNFGAVPSNLNGIMAAEGDAVLLCLPADMQDPPEMIADFVRHWSEGYEVVCGVRSSREEGLIMRTCRRIYYYLADKLADVAIPHNVGLFQLVDRKVIKTLKRYDDYQPFIRGIIADSGFRTKQIPYAWKARQHGKSKIPIYSLIDQALNGLLFYTKLPMRTCFFIGGLISLFSLLYAAYSVILALWIYPEQTVAGIPTLISAIFFFAGIQIIFMGILGEYISAIHAQVRRRPAVIERERLNFKSQTDRERTSEDLDATYRDAA